jgi:ABC-type multidrug transport system ATPase subunit
VDSNNKVTGVVAKASDGETLKIAAKAVILATGGYAGDPQLVKKYAGDAAKGMAYAGGPGTTGEMTEAAIALGADTIDMEQLFTTPTAAVESNMLITAMVLSNGAIIVNSKGMRFCDETASPNTTFDNLKNSGEDFVFEVFDVNVRDSVYKIQAVYMKQGIVKEARTVEELAAMMVGRPVEFSVKKEKASPGGVVLRVEDLVVKDYWGHKAVDGLSLSVRAGEIVGIAGVDGNGQSEFVAALTGLRKAESGRLSLSGVDIFNRSPRFIFESGVSSIPEDRHKYGLVLDFLVAENMVLQNVERGEFSRHGFLREKNILAHARTLIRQYDIRPVTCASSKTVSLSGGNQQKVIIAREVSNNKDLLVCVNPTRGLDVGAIEYVHRYIVAQRDAGKAVLLVSFELSEIMNLSDRIDVMFRGRISGSVSGEKADQTELGLMMAGGKA